MSSRLPSHGDSSPSSQRLKGKLLRPRIDLIERPQDFRLFFDLPGGQLGNIDLAIEKGVLSLSAEVQTGAPAGRLVTWQLNVDFDDLLADDALQAVFEGGVLLITLPKAPGAGGLEKVRFESE